MDQAEIVGGGCNEYKAVGMTSCDHDVPTDPAIEHDAKSTTPDQSEQHGQEREAGSGPAELSIAEADNASDAVCHQLSSKPVHKRKLPRMLTQPTPTAKTANRMAKTLPAKNTDDHQKSKPRRNLKRAGDDRDAATAAVVPRRKVTKPAASAVHTAVKHKKVCKEDVLLQVDGVTGPLCLRVTGAEMLATSDDQLLEEVRCVLHRSSGHAAAIALPSPHRTLSSSLSEHEQQQPFPLPPAPADHVSSSGKAARVDKGISHGRRHDTGHVAHAPAADKWLHNTTTLPSYAGQRIAKEHTAIDDLETQPLEILYHEAPQKLQAQLDLQLPVQPHPYYCKCSTETHNVVHQRQAQHDMRKQGENPAEGLPDPLSVEAMSRSSAPQLISPQRHSDKNPRKEITPALARHSTGKGEKRLTSKSASMWDIIDLPEIVHTKHTIIEQLQHTSRAPSLEEGATPDVTPNTTSSSTAASDKKQRRSAFSYFDDMLKADDAM